MLVSPVHSAPSLSPSVGASPDQDLPSEATEHQRTTSHRHGAHHDRRLPTPSPAVSLPPAARGDAPTASSAASSGCWSTRASHFSTHLSSSPPSMTPSAAASTTSARSPPLSSRFSPIKAAFMRRDLPFNAPMQLPASTLPARNPGRLSEGPHCVGTQLKIVADAPLSDDAADTAHNLHVATPPAEATADTQPRFGADGIAPTNPSISASPYHANAVPDSHPRLIVAPTSSFSRVSIETLEARSTVSTPRETDSLEAVGLHSSCHGVAIDTSRMEAMGKGNATEKSVAVEMAGGSTQNSMPSADGSSPTRVADGGDARGHVPERRSNSTSEDPSPRRQQWRWLRNRRYDAANHAVIQVAGHSGMFHRLSESVLVKQGTAGEAAAYAGIAGTSLENFVPKCLHSVCQGDVQLLYIEDLTSRYIRPCVMDIKIGTRTFLESDAANPKRRLDLMRKIEAIDPSALSEEERMNGVTKLRYMRFREMTSSTATLGWRVEGIRRSNGTRQVLTFPSAKTLQDLSELEEAFRWFTQEREDVLQAFTRRLAALQNALEQVSRLLESNGRRSSTPTASQAPGLL